MINENGIKTQIRTIDKKELKQFRKSIESRENTIRTSQLEANFVAEQSLKRLINVLPFCSTTYAKSLWEKVEGYHAVRHVNPDSCFINKIFKLNPKVLIVHQPLFSYRVHTENVKKISKNIKHPIDQYINTLEYSDDYLNSINLNRKQLIDEMLSKDCGKHALRYLRNGNYKIAMQMFFFAFATYPERAILNRNILLLGLFLILGPIGILLLKLKNNQ